MTTIAILPGSYDPFTHGHREIVARASHLFGEVMITVAKHPTKPGFFDLSTRVDLIQASTEGIPNVSIRVISGLMFDYARKISRQFNADVVFVRGLRPQGDFASEFLLAMGNRDAAPEIETVFLLSSPNLLHVSSSLVREMASHGADVSRYVHPAVAAAFEAKRNREYPV